MDKNGIIKAIKGGLIVSCQALEDEPLHSSYIMGRLAKAAEIGGAVGIRANTYKDCVEIKKNVKLPIIGIYKKEYSDSEVYITPTINEVREIMKADIDILAFDATKRRRPWELKLEDFVVQIKNEFKGLLMADISTYEEGIKATKLGADLISTTLSGYTNYTLNDDKPNFKLIEKLSKNVDIPVIAEGNIKRPEQAAECFKRGAYAIVVGGAITRPQLITRDFVQTINNLTKGVL